MARYIDEAKLVQAILRERDKIPLTVPCAPYELLDERANAYGQAQRSGIRKALRCVAETPTADVAPKSEVAREIFEEIIEGLEEEKRREEQCRNSALESGDLVIAELYDYAADKLDTIITALNLCKKKYTEEKE